MLEIVLAPILAYAILHPSTWSEHFGTPPGLREYVAIACCPILIFGALSILYEIIFQRGRAIWLEDGMVKYIDTYWSFGVRTAKLDEIKSAQVGAIHGTVFGVLDMQAIVLVMKDASQQKIRTWFLSEPPDDVVATLNSCLTGIGR